MNITSTTESEREAADVKPARLEQLYAQHAPGGMRLALLLTGNTTLAEDLLQDAFVRIAGRFGHLRNRKSFGAYLNRTIVNLARDRGRRSRLERREMERASGSIVTRTTEPDVDSRQTLLAVLETLPYRQRAAVVLRYYEDLSEQQVADALDCSLTAAKSLISRGMESLRNALGGTTHD